jgi:phage baseplate assembly protein V
MVVRDMADPADPQRLIGDLAREGLITSVDLDAGTCRVQLADELITGDLPWLCSRIGKTRVWSPPSVGEQVLVIAPEADAARGIVIGSLSSNDNPHPANDGSTLIEFEDGARIGYDPVGHALAALLPGGSSVIIDATGGLTLKGDLHVDGDVRATGTVSADGDVIGAGKSLKGHKHLGVQTGGGVTGVPQ